MESRVEPMRLACILAVVGAAWSHSPLMAVPLIAGGCEIEITPDWSITEPDSSISEGSAVGAYAVGADGEVLVLEETVIPEQFIELLMNSPLYVAEDERRPGYTIVIQSLNGTEKKSATGFPMPWSNIRWLAMLKFP